MLVAAAAVVEPVYDHAAMERARLVNEARALLLRSGGVVTVEQVAQATGRRADTVRQWLSRRVRAGRMVSVRHDGATLVPSFQLTEAFDEDPEISELVSRLVAAGMSGWAVWDWFVTPNTWLDGATPLEELRSGDASAVDRALAGLLQE